MKKNFVPIFFIIFIIHQESSSPTDTFSSKKEVHSGKRIGRLLRIVAAISLLIGGLVHLQLYFGEGYHQDKKCKLYCLDAADGRILWEREAPYKTLEKIHTIGSHAQPTPVSDGMSTRGSETAR
jgi:outer membrane protein assembly factor BamB